MEVKPALALPEGLEVTDIGVIDKVLTITAVSTQVRPACPSAVCLLCGCIAATAAKLLTCHVVGNRYACCYKCASIFAM